MELTEKAIEELMSAFAKSGLAKMRVRDGEQEIAFTAAGMSADTAPAGGSAAGRPTAPAEAADTMAVTEILPSGKTDDAEKSASSEEKTSGTVLKAPLAGVFHRAAKEGDSPIAEPGQKVRKGQTVALMEAMKMVSEVKAPCDGTVLEILAEDGKFCEYQEPLMRFGE
jgi:acetyl-CoA carboxylase biotin carboxyl carrier protein